MGSIEEQLDVQDDFIVVVTGFAPFGHRYPVNPSWEIARSLPPLIPLTTTKTTSHPPRNIRVLVHPSPVKVSYATVRSLVPGLWKSVPRIDLMVHIGMASGRRFYSVERRGHREGYRMGDVDGVVLGDEKERYGDDWIWRQDPEELLSDVDIDGAWKRWKDARPDDDVRISEDAGRYLCDFIYYSSLAHLWEAKEQKRVVFMHVPVESDDASILKGTAITVEMIRCIAQSMLAKKEITVPTL